MSLTVTIPGAVEATTGATAPATLTVGVGVPGATGAQGPAGPGVPTGGTAGQFLTKIDGTNYNTDWTTVNFTQYLTTSAAASTYQPLSGMSSYLTTSAAATNYAPLSHQVPAGGTTGQILGKSSSSDWDLAWTTIVPGDRYLTSSTTSLSISTGSKTLTIGTNLSYSSQQDIVIAYDASNHMHAVVTSYNSSTGVMVVDVQNKTGSGTYASWTVNVGGTVPLQSVAWGEIVGTLGNQSDLSTALNAKLDTSTAASTYAPLAGATFTGEVATPASTTTSAGFSIAPGVAPTSPTNGEIWNSGTELLARISGVSETLARQSWVTAQGYITSSALTPYAPLAGATFTGLVNTPAATTTTAGFRLPHGTAPTTPTDGDVWTTTGNLWVRINGVSQAIALQGNSAQLSSNNIFTNASSTYGNSTAAGTINLGTGATISGATRTINIGTASAASSTNNINIGGGSGTITTTVAGTLTATGTTLNLGNSTAASTINLGTGATLTATTKAVNIGTNGVPGSTTNIAIGSTTGTSTTTLQGTTNGVTVAADTNSTALATTAYVVGQAGSATPLVDGTAAVGTSLRYARQDHVHPTDTTRAPLASPTFTGTPAAPTAAVDTNTTQIATTAYVVGQGYAKLASPTLTGTPAAPTAAVDTNTTQIATTAYVVGQGYLKSSTASSTYAPLASPALTGTPTAPTATAGTNTTQIATTAFVTAAVPTFGATADINSPSSTTKAASIDNVREMMLNPGYQLFYLGVGVSGTALSGYYNSNGGRYKDYQSSTTSGSYGQWCFDTNSSSQGYVGFTRGQTSNYHDWSKKIWLTGRCQIGTWNSGGNGDVNGVARIGLGGRNGFGSGDFAVHGIGWKVAGGGTSALVLTVHNGSTLTNVTSSFTPTLRQAFDWKLYSDGAGNVTLYVNDSQVATTSSGPTGNTTNGLYFEGVDAIATVTTVFTLHTYGTKIYHST